MTDARDKTGERLAFAILMLFMVGFGWLNLLQGGISLKGKSGDTTFVTGTAGLAVATGTFVIGALVSLLMARSFGLGRVGTISLAMAILLPPLVFVLFPG